MKPTLVYIFDPLCGWCFGFHPVMEKLADRFENQLTVEVIPGGLAVDENVRTIGKDYEYILSESDRVKEVTGRSIGQNFILLAEEGSYVYNSEPACRAQNVVNALRPDCSLEFAGKLQNAFFVEAENLNEWHTFEKLMSDLPVNTESTKKLFTSEKIKHQTKEKFKWCKQHGASAFPTLLLQIENEIGLMSRGYRPFDTLESHLHHLLNNMQKLES